ncbi:MAG: phosphodiesterase [Clostridia bacterium]|nr:phosphodiesterase [Clostridia bacterium]
MKLFIASDIHGDYEAASAVAERYRESGADRLVLLGDLLYHGPRNDLPSGYAPKKVIELLNSLKDDILAVRGNCEAEVDQMVLEFPVLAEYALIEADGVRMFVTHGHKYNMGSLPPLRAGEVLLHGHTHVTAAVAFGNGNLYINPGSVSIPKENTPKGYVIYEDGCFSFRRLSDGGEFDAVTVRGKS